MKIACDKRCIIGEGPIWNETEQKLYFTNGMTSEICRLDICSGKLGIRSLDFGCAAFCFDKNNKIIVSTDNGVFILNHDNTNSPIYDTNKHNLKYCNDMKVGPDGAIYVGTLSELKKGISNKLNGRLYRIDKMGNVKTLLDGLHTPNGLEWSMDEKKFYYVSGGDNPVKEYHFDKQTGNIEFTGRSISVPGADGMTIDKNDNLLIACWGFGHIAVVDTKKMQIDSYIQIPSKIPSSCAFVGDNMDLLAITTASYNTDISKDENSGFTLLEKRKIGGRKPYLFGL
ncbi:MAG: SMP-30/gluconolactonase/LRE family protein [Clostridia bacterium]|nr:SMP-30/gluconolactonase/LRE family protein [Clostridia bacterium]